MEDTGDRVVVTCACGQKMKLPADAKGKKYKCVKCGGALTLLPGIGHAESKPAKATAAPVPASRERMGQMLIKAGLITPQQLSEALDVQQRDHGKIIEILVRLGHLDKDALHEFLSRQPGVAAINLSRYNLENELVNVIPKELALRELVLPIDRLGKLLTVAMACPLDVDTIEELQRITGLKVKAMLCRLDDIHNAVEKLYRQRGGGTLEGFEHILAKAQGVTAPPASVLPAPAPPVLDSAASAHAPAAPAASVPAPQRDLTPDIVERFITMAEDASVSTQEFARAVAGEAGLADVLIHAANSGPYGAAGKVRSPGMAIALLGRDGVVDLLRLAFQ